MQIGLKDKDRTGMCMIGTRLSFTWDNPGPIDIDVNKLTPEEVKQVVYNVNRGVLTVDPVDELQALVDKIPPATALGGAPVAHIPPVTPQQSLDPAKEIEDDIKKLNKLLLSSIDTIKKETRGFRAARLRRLRELETEGQKRDSLLVYLDELLKTYTASVAASVGNEDVGGKFAAHAPGSVSTQVGDVVESEMQEITFYQE